MSEELNLEELKARCDAAAHGPWHRVYGGGGRYEVMAKSNGLAVAVEMHICDAEFIAHARMDVPNLIREIERLRAAFGRRGAQEEEGYTLKGLAQHLGYGDMSAKDAYAWLFERSRLLRVTQDALETHKSSAATAEEAIKDRIAALRTYQPSAALRGVGVEAGAHGGTPQENMCRKLVEKWRASAIQRTRTVEQEIFERQCADELEKVLNVNDG